MASFPRRRRSAPPLDVEFQTRINDNGRVQDITASFEANRSRLQGVAYRMLGSLAEAEDAVQEAWLKASRAESEAVENLDGWLTTIVSRVCLDVLRARKARKEDLGSEAEVRSPTDPERENTLADAVGIALLVVLRQLDPAERIAFVLHDTVGMPFEEIAPIVDRTVEATRQLASRARRQVRGTRTDDASPDREVVAAFLGALRSADYAGLIAVLDPDVRVRMGDKINRGAENWAKNATQFSKAAGAVVLALVDGRPALLFAPRGKLIRVITFVVEGPRIVEAEIVTDRARLDAFAIALA